MPFGMRRSRNSRYVNETRVQNRNIEVRQQHNICLLGITKANDWHKRRSTSLFLQTSERVNGELVARLVALNRRRSDENHERLTSPLALLFMLAFAWGQHIHYNYAASSQ